MAEKNQLSINVPADKASGTYSNMAIVCHNPSEFVIDFVALMPNMPQASVVSRIVQTPENTKKLLYALKENIEKYEAQFGPIELKGKPAPGSTLPLFGGGEA